MLRDAGDLLLPAVRASISAMQLTDADQSAVKLAERYAALIDGAFEDPKLYAWSLRWIGPLLLDALESLGATPVARDKIKDRKVPGSGGQLARLRASRGA